MIILYDKYLINNKMIIKAIYLYRDYCLKSYIFAFNYLSKYKHSCKLILPTFFTTNCVFESSGALVPNLKDLYVSIVNPSL